MEKLPSELAIGNAVDGVTDNGEVDCGKVDTNLMCAAGLESDRKQGVFRQKLLHLEMRDRFPRPIRVERPAKRVMAVPADGSVDSATA